MHFPSIKVRTRTVPECVIVKKMVQTLLDYFMLPNPNIMSIYGNGKNTKGEYISIERVGLFQEFDVEVLLSMEEYNSLLNHRLSNKQRSVLTRLEVPYNLYYQIANENTFEHLCTLVV